MGNLIGRKKEKAFAIFEVLGDELNEGSFVCMFQEQYPEDWSLIQETFAFEERNTKPGKRHPMPHSDLYMKNMFRNLKKKWDAEKGE